MYLGMDSLVWVGVWLQWSFLDAATQSHTSCSMLRVRVRLRTGLRNLSFPHPHPWVIDGWVDTAPPPPPALSLSPCRTGHQAAAYQGLCHVGRRFAALTSACPTRVSPATPLPSGPPVPLALLGVPQGRPPVVTAQGAGRQRLTEPPCHPETVHWTWTATAIGSLQGLSCLHCLVPCFTPHDLHRRYCVMSQWDACH